ncbi:hypothetical protein HY251_13895 [bacterium]|nr:hypothetical protein [bacterium]
MTRFTTSTTGWYPWLTVPAHPDHDPRERLARACRAARVECLDPSAGFPEDPRSYLAPRRDGRLDPHYGRSGTRAYGEALAPRVAAILEGR